MIIYYSGTQGKENLPESRLEEAHIMLTFFDNMDKPEERLLAILEDRKKKRKKHERR